MLFLFARKYYKIKNILIGNINKYNKREESI